MVNEKWCPFAYTRDDEGKTVTFARCMREKCGCWSYRRKMCGLIKDMQPPTMDEINQTLGDTVKLIEGSGLIPEGLLGVKKDGEES